MNETNDQSLNNFNIRLTVLLKQKERRLQIMEERKKNLSDFGIRLERLLEEKGITKTQVCLALLVNPQSLYKWTSGRSYPEIEHLKQLSALIGCSVDSLLGCEKEGQEDRDEQEEELER